MRVFYKPKTMVSALPTAHLIGAYIDVMAAATPDRYYYPDGDFFVSKAYCTVIEEENEFGVVSP